MNGITLLVLLLVTASCKKEKDNFIHVNETCSLEGNNILTIREATGTLLYKGMVLGSNSYEVGIFIPNNNIEEVKLPLQVCNFPLEEFPALKVGDSLEPICHSSRVRDRCFQVKFVVMPEIVNS